MSSDGKCKQLIDYSGTNMQDFTSEMCDDLPVPFQYNYHPVGTLIDERDGKSYEIRKFADGKCWMVDNLAYGGNTSTDACAGRTGYISINSTSPTNLFGAGTYGDCRSYVVASKVCDTINPNTGVSVCGYFYNWLAIMQNPNAYFNVTNFNYTQGIFDVGFTGTPSITNHYQGICPDGWHLPSGGTTATASEFITLDIAYGGTGANSQTGTSYTSFWKPASATAVTSSQAWKGLYPGRVSPNSLGEQGTVGYWSSSTYTDATYNSYGGRNAYLLSVSTSNISPQLVPNNGNWYYGSMRTTGVSVRCIAD
jgi:uncharacterized protein (TIGR02145 family)